jgi:hypothetical protein
MKTAIRRYLYKSFLSYLTILIVINVKDREYNKSKNLRKWFSGGGGGGGLA